MSSRPPVPLHPALPALNRALRRGAMDRREFLTRASWRKTIWLPYGALPAGSGSAAY